MAAESDPILVALTKAAAGLLFISETEAELEPFVWEVAGPLDAAQVLSQSDYEYEEGTPVEEMTLKDFFRAVPSEEKESFDRLASVLTQQLSDVRVFKVGEVEKDVYIVGRTNDNRCAGLFTQVVET